jgi:hypothetical protein
MSLHEHLQVHGETDIGWCAETPPNETTNAAGEPEINVAGFSAADPRAPKRRAYDDPEVCALRERLRARNGMPGLEICAPDEIERAARIFFRDGFVVVRDALDGDQLATFREASARVLKAILDIPGIGRRKYLTETNRLPHRYSYGTASASRQLLHEPVWASMIDLPTTTPLLTRIFGGPDYWVTGAGGDLCLPGAIEYQTLHSDQQERFSISPHRLEVARRIGLKLRFREGSEELEDSSRQLVYERTPSNVTINFLMSDLTAENGPIRQIPGTQARPGNPPTQADEPEWMRFSTLVGAPAGSAIFRDLRAWHGATPNVSREIRAMPNVEYAAPWLEPERFRISMPHEIWRTLSPHARAISGRVVAEPGVPVAGAGIMHPIADARSEARGPDAAPVPLTGMR